MIPPERVAIVRQREHDVVITLGTQRGRQVTQRGKLYAHGAYWEQELGPMLYALGYTIVLPSGERLAGVP